MAIRQSSIKGGNGFPVTYEIDSASDISSLSNSTFFRQADLDYLVRYKDSSGNTVDAFSSSSIPQANKIYVDSINGVDSTGRGRVDNPYLTIGYALTQISNTGTFTGNTTNTGQDITSVTGVSNVQIGQYVIGTNIPLHTRVVAISGTTVTLSKPATGTATGTTFTYYTPYTIITSGDFSILSGNLLKYGVNYEFGDSTIAFSGTLLDTYYPGLQIPFYLNGGHFSGRVSTARLINNSYGNTSDIYITPKSYFSNGTGSAISDNSTMGRNFVLKCTDFVSNLGYIGTIQVTGKAFIEGNYYGLLGGLTLGTSNLAGKYYVYGVVETPASVNAINHGYYGSTILFFNGQIIGQLSSIGSTNFSGSATGTSHTIGASSGITSRTIINGDLNGSVTLSGDSTRPVEFNGATANGGSFTNTASFAIIKALYGNYTGTGASVGIIETGSQNGWSSFFKDITLSGTSQLTLGKNLKLTGFITYGQVPSINIGSGCKLIISEYAYGMLYNSGEVVINGTFDYETNQYAGATPQNTGTLIINGTLNLNRNGGEASSNTPTYAVSSGTIIVNGGKVYCGKADSKSGLFRKTATGGKIILRGHPQLIVSNGLAPLQILSNTGTAQDVHNFGVITNGAVGFRIADTFSDTTYGTAYAPNLIGTATNNEDTTYTF